MIVLSGSDLTVADVVRVAREDASVAFDRAAIARMKKARKVVERAIARGEPVYGTNTGVAANKRHEVGRREMAAFNRLLVDNHRVGQGPLAPRELVRAMLLRMANGFARGTTPASPELAALVLAALERGEVPPVRTLGSLGVSDLAPNADLAHGILGDYALAPGEALVIISNAAFTVGSAALALADAARLAAAMEVAGALELEAFAGNLGILDPALVAVKPLAGYRAAAANLRTLLAGSFAHRSPRNLQDPLTYRGMPLVFGAVRDALDYAFTQVTAELNATNENPIVARGRLLSNWNGEIVGLAAALDFVRIALAPVVTSAAERLVKLLQAPLTGLPSGLTVRSGLAECGLAEYGIAAQALAAEARLLAMPVSFELASTSQAEGIEDRTTMAPLGARRLAEMVALGEGLCAIELLVAAQAIDLRKKRPLGKGTARAHAKIRERVPFVGRGASIPADLEPLRALVRSGSLGAHTP